MKQLLNRKQSFHPGLLSYFYLFEEECSQCVFLVKHSKHFNMWILLELIQTLSFTHQTKSTNYLWQNFLKLFFRNCKFTTINLWDKMTLEFVLIVKYTRFKDACLIITKMINIFQHLERNSSPSTNSLGLVVHLEFLVWALYDRQMCEIWTGRTVHPISFPSATEFFQSHLIIFVLEQINEGIYGTV